MRLQIFGNPDGRATAAQVLNAHALGYAVLLKAHADPVRRADAGAALAQCARCRRHLTRACGGRRRRGTVGLGPLVGDCRILML